MIDPRPQRVEFVPQSGVMLSRQPNAFGCWSFWSDVLLACRGECRRGGPNQAAATDDSQALGGRNSGAGGSAAIVRC